MKRIRNWALVWGAVLALGPVCQGQDMLNEEPPATICGTVRDPAGKPATGVLVTFHPGTYRGAPDYTEARTDASGRYEIVLHPNQTPQGEWGVSPRQCLLARDIERNLAATYEFIRTPTNVNLDLQPGITLSGLAKSANGVLVTNAWVDLRFQSDRAVFHLGPHPLTVDAQGSFSIPAMPRGHDFYFTDGISAPGYNSASALLAAKNSQTDRYQFPAFVLKKADRRLAGRVVDDEKKPLAGASVTFYGLNQPLYSNSTRTDAQGCFAFDGVSDGPLKLTAGFVGPAGSGIVLNSVGGGIEVQAGATNIVVPLQEPSVRPPFPIPAIGKPGPPVTTAGTVSDPSGEPAPDVSIIIWRSKNQDAMAHSDAAGKYAIQWQRMAEPVNSAPSSAMLIARDLAHNRAVTQDVDETSTNVPLRLQKGGIVSGSVLATDGTPVTNAEVELHLSLNRMSGVLAEAWSDARGLFSFNALPEVGDLFLSVTADGYAVSNSVKVSFAAAEGNKVELAPIRLKPATMEVAGRLIGPDGKPVPGMWMSFSGASQAGDIIFTDAEGRFDFKQVAEGTWFLYVYKARINGAPPLNGRIQGEGSDLHIEFKLPVTPEEQRARQAAPRGGARPVPTNSVPPIGPWL